MMNLKRKREVPEDNPSKRSIKEKYTIYISNLSSNTKWFKVKELFKRITGEIVYITLFVDKDNKPNGNGVVQFESESAMLKALQINSTHKFILEGQLLDLKNDNGIERDKFGNKKLNNIPKHDDVSYQRPHNTYGLSSQYLESLELRVPLSNRIIVSKLHKDVDQAKLKEVFKMAGKIRNICINKFNQTRDYGSAIIEYEHPVQAVQAISMFRNKKLFERHMYIVMDEENTTNKWKLPIGLESIGPGLGLNGEPLRDVTKYLPLDNKEPSSEQSKGINIGVLESIPIYTSTNGNFTIQPLGLLEQGIDVPNLNITQGLPAAGQLQNMPNTIQNGVNPNINMPIFSQPPFDVSNMPIQMDNLQHMPPPYLPISNAFSTATIPKTNINMDTIVVDNLPSSITWEILHEKFGVNGPIDFVERVGPYTAMIKFRDPLSAIQAIKMYDKTCIDGRKMDIHYC